MNYLIQLHPTVAGDQYANECRREIIRFARINRMDQAIHEAEKEVAEGAGPVTPDAARTVMVPSGPGKRLYSRTRGRKPERIR